jgi:hypothetical protein
VAVDQSILSFDLTSEFNKEFSDASSGNTGERKRSFNGEEEDDDDEEVAKRPPQPSPVSATGMKFDGFTMIQGEHPFLLPQSLTISTWVKPEETAKESPIFAKGQEDLESFVFAISSPPPHQTRAASLWMMTNHIVTGHKFYLDKVEMGRW